MLTACFIIVTYRRGLHIYHNSREKGSVGEWTGSVVLWGFLGYIHSNRVVL